MVVGINGIPCFPDASMPRFLADNMRGKRTGITREDVLGACRKNPGVGRRELAGLPGCSEQTIRRRLEDNNVGGGRSVPQTKVMLTGSMLASMAGEHGPCLYGRRIWRKDPCRITCRRHAISYRAVDGFGRVCVFRMPGMTRYGRGRLPLGERPARGSGGVWRIKSVRGNMRHGAEFPEDMSGRVMRPLYPAGGVVLDPLAGTGTATAVARRLGRRRPGRNGACFCRRGFSAIPWPVRCCLSAARYSVCNCRRGFSAVP